MYDFNNMNLVKNLLSIEPNGVFFDIGANIGSYTILASEVNTALVVAFEPSPSTFKALEENIALNDRQNVLAFQIACGEKNDHAFLSDFGRHSSVNRLIREFQGKKVVKIAMRTCDSISQEIHISPTVCKIDVEGFELEVLKGFQKTIRNCLALIIECGERKDVENFLRIANFIGPLFYHHKEKAFNKIQQGRKEDSVYINNKYIEKLRRYGFSLSLSSNK